MAGEDELSQRLLERLVSDPGFRAAFRRDPVAAARSAGLGGLADDLLAAGSDPLQTLDLRESRSSLAGVVMAAAFEGIGMSSPHSLGGGGGSASTPEDVAARDAARSDRRVWASHVAPQPETRGAGASVVETAEPVHAHERIDPAQYGMEGSGGRPSAETLSLLENRRVTFDPDGIADLRAGRIDPRLVSLLTTLSRRHTMTISAMCSDHPKLTTGGSVSNHYYGRALDIATIDGRPVGPGNAVAKRVAIELATLGRAIRPTEIGSPWALPGPAYFSDAGHQNHLHIGFDDPITRDWRPPDGVPAEAATPPERSADSGAIEPDDTEAQDDDSGSDDAGDDGDVREDGGSGDTDAEADDDEDSGDDDDEDDEDDDDDDEDDDDDDDDDEDDDDEDDDDEDEDEDDDEDEDASGDDAGAGSSEDPGIVADGYPDPRPPAHDHSADVLRLSVITPEQARRARNEQA
jgi:hypothetical protein